MTWPRWIVAVVALCALALYLATAGGSPYMAGIPAALAFALLFSPPRGPVDTL